MKKVLILEDEVNIRSFVVINLKRAGYEPIEAATGTEALERIAENPDIGVAILDIMVPEIDGFEVCRRIRATNKQMGIIMLTARTQEMDKVTGLMTGADDYVTKPFSPAELTARIDALYRRIGGDNHASSELLTQGIFVMKTAETKQKTPYGVFLLSIPSSENNAAALSIARSRTSRSARRRRRATRRRPPKIR